jgi:hypothetical protein
MKMVEHSLHILKAKLEKQQSNMSSLLLQSNFSLYERQKPSKSGFLDPFLSANITEVSRDANLIRSTYPSFHVKSNMKSSKYKNIGKGLLSYANSQIKTVHPSIYSPKASPTQSFFKKPAKAVKTGLYSDPTQMFRGLKEYEDSRFKKEIQHLEKLKISHTVDNSTINISNRRPSSRRTINSNSKRKGDTPNKPTKTDDTAAGSAECSNRQINTNI